MMVLILRAQSIGMPIMFVPVVLVVMNVAYAYSAYPVGILSDRFDRFSVMTWRLSSPEVEEIDAIASWGLG